MPSIDLNALTREQRRALFTQERPKKASARLMPTEADALMKLVSGHRFAGVWARADHPDRYSRDFGAHLRLFDRGLADIVASREDGFLQLGFASSAAEMEAHRLLSAPHVRLPVLAWCRRGLQEGTMPLTVPMAVSMLAWHYSDPEEGQPVVEVAITRPRRRNGTTGEPAPYRFTTRLRDGSTRTQQVSTSFADNIPDDDTSSAQTVELDRRVRSLITQTPGKLNDYHDGYGTYDDDALSVLAWVCRNTTPFAPFNPRMDGTTNEPHPKACGDVVIDLTRFTVLPKQTARRTSTNTHFDNAAPAVLRDALTTLEAPSLPTAAAFIDWAEQHCTLTISCGGTIPESEQEFARFVGKIAGKGAKRHTLHLDPHAHRLQRITTGNKQQDTAAVEAEHMLWALSMGSENGCDRALHLLNTLAAIDLLSRYTRFSAKVVEKAHSVRTIARAVAYLDAGLDLSATSHFLAVGLPGPHVARIMAAITDGTTTLDHAIAEISEVLDRSLGTPPSGDSDMEAITQRIIDPTHDANADPIGRRTSALHEAILKA